MWWRACCRFLAAGPWFNRSWVNGIDADFERAFCDGLVSLLVSLRSSGWRLVPL
jgi:hypothetical protein